MTGADARFAAWLIAMTCLAGCKPAEPPPEPPRAVNVVRIEAGKGANTANYTGDVRARYETALGFRVGGKIASRLVDVGDVVRKGQVLMRLDPSDQRLSEQAAGDALSAARASHDQAVTDFKRFEDLFRRGFISAAEFDRHRTTLDVATARLSEARAQLDMARNQADYTTLHAQADGVVTLVDAEAGQVVGPGQPVVRVARPGQKEVAFSVPENQLDRVHSGVSVRVDLWALPGHAYAGRVREVSPVADPVTRTYLAKASITDADRQVQLGMTAAVHVEEGESPSVIRLPTTALFQKGDDTAVWVVDPASSQVTLRPVKVGRYAEDYITVVEGLEPGQMVVRAGVQKLFPNQKVRVLADRAQ